MDRYEQITQRIIDALEKGVTPWVKPWKASSEMPHNGVSKHVYRGINMLMCWSSPYTDPRWYTFNQIKGYGRSHVRKGEAGTPIIKWLFIEKVDETENEDGEVETKSKRIPVLKAYMVWNYEQVEWDADRKPKEPESSGVLVDPAAVYAEAAGALERSGLVVRHGGDKACFIPSLDVVKCPRPETFESTEAYWSTVWHEATHWTGHKDRLNRTFGSRWGDETYAAEELVAELGSAFLCADLGIQGKLQHPEYIGHWLNVMRGDKYAIFTAARLAREAVAYIRRNDPKEEAVLESEAVAA